MSEFDPITGQLVIMEGSTEVPTGQFERNEEIKRVALPDTLLKINDQGFAYTSNLEDIDFGESLVSLGKESFFATFSLKNHHSRLRRGDWRLCLPVRPFTEFSRHWRFGHLHWQASLLERQNYEQPCAW